MTEAPEVPDDPEGAAARKRRLAEVFGDVLPDTTSDERDEGSDSTDGRDESARGTPGTATRYRQHHGLRGLQTARLP